MPYCLTCGNKKFESQEAVAQHILDNKSDHTPAGIKWAEQLLKIEPVIVPPAIVRLNDKDVTWHSENLTF